MRDVADAEGAVVQLPGLLPGVVDELLERACRAARRHHEEIGVLGQHRDGRELIGAIGQIAPKQRVEALAGARSQKQGPAIGRSRCRGLRPDHEVAARTVVGHDGRAQLLRNAVAGRACDEIGGSPRRIGDDEFRRASRRALAEGGRGQRGAAGRHEGIQQKPARDRLEGRIVGHRPYLESRVRISL